MTPELQKKIDQAVKLIRLAGADGETVEVAYSGGKDSDVILELARMSGIKYRAFYKNTTIDPPGTIKHAIENGAEVVKPKQTFFEICAETGLPNRWRRICCGKLKEYKILDKSIIGVRKAESVKRAARYKEPTECRFYGSKKNHVEAFYPILDWSDQDVADFVKERGIKCHSLYYDEQGNFHVERRLGCLCCPLAYRKKRIEQFKKYPRMIVLYLRAGQKFRDTHPDAAFTKNYDNIYDAFVRFLFYNTDNDFKQSRNGLFEPIDCKTFLEKYFNINLDCKIIKYN